MSVDGRDGSTAGARIRPPLVVVDDGEPGQHDRADLLGFEAELRAYMRDAAAAMRALEVGIQTLDRERVPHPLFGVGVLATIDAVDELHRGVSTMSASTPVEAITRAITASLTECHRGLETLARARDGARDRSVAQLGRARAAARRATMWADDARAELVRHRLRLGLESTAQLPRPASAVAAEMAVPPGPSRSTRQRARRGGTVNG